MMSGMALSGRDWHSGPIEVRNGEFHLDPKLIAPGLDLDPADIPALLRRGEITSLCESGLEVDLGLHRLTFFHGGRRLQLVIDAEGHIVQRGVLDFGSRPLPAAAHKPGG